MRTFLFAAAVTVAFGSVSVCKAAPPSAAWPKSWYDEFDQTTTATNSEGNHKPDTSKWAIGQYPWGARLLLGGTGSPNYAASYGADNDSYLDTANGYLVLRCRASDGSSEFGGYSYSHGMVTHGAYGAWTYGRLEIRAQYPGGSKVWPAFWMLASGWPPEIDIAEYFGADNRMHNGLAYGSGTWDSTSFYDGDYQGWHTYALEWGPGYAIWYKDDVQKKSVYASYVPSVAMYVLLNAGMRSVSGSTTLPNYFSIDYFRYYNPPAAVVNDATTGTGTNAFNYVGSWSSASQSGAFFSDNHYSATTNAYYTVQFYGTRADVYGAKASSHGIAAVSVDGGAETLVDCYASSRSDMALLRSVSGLDSGTHTIKVRVTGTKNASSSGYAVTADRVDVWNTTASLPGTIIGTAGSYQSSGNTRDKAMDGDLATYFDGPTTSGVWVGYDLGAVRKITQVLYCPRTGFPARMVGGKFQGANSGDFGDAVDLFTVATAPYEGTMTTQAISNTNGFRYVRYLGPSGSSGNLAEVEFYGSPVTCVWSADADGSWSDTTKWSNGAVGLGSGDVADFSTLNIGASRTVTLDSSRTIGSLKFGDTSGSDNWVLSSSGGSILTLDPGTATGPTITVNQNTATISAPLAGVDGFTKTGSNTGVLSLSGVNTFTGDVTIANGSLRVTNSNSLGTGTKTIAVSNGTAGNSQLRLDGSSGSIALPGTFTYNTSNLGGAIFNEAGNNSIAGQINMTAGGGATVIQSDAGTLTVSADITATTTGRALILQGDGNGTVSGVISNGSTTNLPMTKNGLGTWTLSAANTYTGATTINGGTLRLAPGLAPVARYTFDNVSGSTAVNDGNGGAAVNGTLTNGATIVSGGRFGNAISLSGGAYVNINSPIADLGNAANWTLSAWVKTTTAGSTILSKGSGTSWTTGNTIFYLGDGTAGGSGGIPSGVRYAGGFLQGSASATSVNDGIWHMVSYVNSGGVYAIYVDGAAQSLSSGNSGFGNADVGTVVRLGFTTNNVAGDGTVNFNGLLDDVQFYGQALSAAQIAALYQGQSLGGSLPSTADITIASGGTLDVNGVSQTIGTLSGGGSLMKTGAGTLTLSGSNSYTGAALLNGGALIVTGTIASGGTLTAANGTTLMGNGTINASATINGTHQPGTSVGTQTFGTLGYGSTARLAWELGSNSVTAGTFDKVTATGPVTITSGAAVDVYLNTSGSTVALNDPFWTQTRSWTILTGSNITGTFALGNVSTDSGARVVSNYGVLALQQSATAVTLTFTPYTPQQNWQRANFGTNWNNAAFAGDTADPENDGLGNMLEYVLGSDPNAASPAAAPQMATAGGKLALTFTRNTAATDLTLTVVGADSPAGAWTDLARSTGGAAFTPIAAGATATEAGTGATRNVEVRDIYLTTDPAHPFRFLRLQVQH